MKLLRACPLRLILLLIALFATNFAGYDEDADDCEDCALAAGEISQNVITGITVDPDPLHIEERQTKTINARLSAAGTASWDFLKPSSRVIASSQLNPASGSSTVLTLEGANMMEADPAGSNVVIKAKTNDAKPSELRRSIWIVAERPFTFVKFPQEIAATAGRTASVKVEVGSPGGSNPVWTITAIPLNGSEYISQISATRINNSSATVNITAKVAGDLPSDFAPGTVRKINFLASATRPGRSKPVQTAELGQFVFYLIRPQ